MTDLDHEWIDVLKVDIEKSEWDMFRDFYAEENATLPVTQLLVEFHFPGEWICIVPNVCPMQVLSSSKSFSFVIKTRYLTIGISPT